MVSHAAAARLLGRGIGGFIAADFHAGLGRLSWWRGSMARIRGGSAAGRIFDGLDGHTTTDP